MNRRDFMRTASVTSLAAPLTAEGLAAGGSASHKSGKLGIATTSYMTVWRPQDTLEFLAHCHDLGADGIQSAIKGEPGNIRAQAEKWHMYVEAMVPMPKGDDTSEFEHALKNAQEAGAVALRSACLGTRRYETFKTLDAWKEHVAESIKSIAAARPLLDQYKIPLGIENHKDWTTEELVELMQKYHTEYFGVCLDFGNNLSLLDPDPMETIEKLATYAVSTHMKDMSVEAAENGFLLAEVVLGTGYLDLPRALSLVRRARPDANFSLEMITRDPLNVPCFDDPYWVTFPDRNGIYLARTLRFVNQHQPFGALAALSQVPRLQQAKVEDDNVIACLQYARTSLGL
jgi:sugar phosphate isomerase/epimerase